ESFASRQIEIFNDAELLNDLRRLKLVEAPGGYRLQASRTAAGHADRGTALALALLGVYRAGAVYFGLDGNERAQPTINDLAPHGVYLDSYREELGPHMKIFAGTSDVGEFDDSQDVDRWSPP